ncbi:universal stress protein YxiE [Pullulanibacillus camelliae]|uniref:Universal stress protein YxiE n=1 Tax=Pullulanibacillus camelliae TaxID=1707096 RepID=A0A8J2YJY7_9BACL|nr:universal stress protein [Pullulanibacillus camelliae]GGE49535.1 universal stress protein YxiE [Pullulanibacillus camelliae]
MGTASQLLVAYDSSQLSQKALSRALAMAQEDEQIKVTAISVEERTMTESIAFANAAVIEEMDKQVEEQILEAKQQLDGLPNPTEVVSLIGHPATLITAYAETHDCDLIIIGSRGLSGFKELMLGSVSHQVVQEAPCAVLIVK